MDFNGAQVTDAGAKKLAAHKDLTNLNLRAPKVKDVGVKEI